jgi:phosphatidylserine/phosphatidylglycerophosphate/cardiolipin synthase-like enzyme
MLVRGAQKTVTIVTTGEGLNRKLEVLMPSLEQCKKRGVKVRIAAPINANNTKVAKEFKKVADVRNLEGINARF